MTPILITLSYWTHSLATTVFIGHFVLLALIYLPVLSKDGNGLALSGISKRSRSWLYAAMIILAITGTYLTIVDPNYLGLGNFGNFWGVMMLIKHILIVGMLLLGFWFNAIMRVGPLLSSHTRAAQAIARFRWYTNAMAISGILVLLLTALAQVK